MRHARLETRRALASVAGETTAHDEAASAVSGRVSVPRHQGHGASAQSLAARIQIRGEPDIAGLILSNPIRFLNVQPLVGGDAGGNHGCRAFGVRPVQNPTPRGPDVIPVLHTGLAGVGPVLRVLNKVAPVPREREAVLQVRRIAVSY